MRIDKYLSGVFSTSPKMSYHYKLAQLKYLGELVAHAERQRKRAELLKQFYSQFISLGLKETFEFVRVD